MPPRIPNFPSTLRLTARRFPVRSLHTNPEPLPLAYDLHKPPTNPSSATAASDGSPILFLHGLFGSKANNRTMSRVLARELNRPVYALDLRNHGDSPHNSRHDYVAMANDVAYFLETHKLSSPTIIGHSMGAKTAMTLALRSPELVQNIVSVDNAPLDAALANDFGKYIRGMKKVEDAGVTKQVEADVILQDFESELPIRQFLLTNLQRNANPQKFRIPLSILARSLGHLGDFPYKDPSTIRFDRPALFVRGTKSLYVPDEVIPLIGQFFPRFRLVDVEAGHWLISENPEAFKRAVIEFLQPQE